MNRTLVLAAFLAALAAGGTALADGKRTPVPTGATPAFFALSVANLDSSIAWYTTHLGFTAQRLPERSDSRAAILRADRVLLELVEIEGSTTLESRVPEARRRYLVQGVFKIGWFVDGIDSTMARLEREGVRLRGGTYDDTTAGVRSALLMDNDGNTIQLFQPLAR